MVRCHAIIVYTDDYLNVDILRLWFNISIKCLVITPEDTYKDNFSVLEAFVQFQYIKYFTKFICAMGIRHNNYVDTLSLNLYGLTFLYKMIFTHLNVFQIRMYGTSITVSFHEVIFIKHLSKE